MNRSEIEKEMGEFYEKSVDAYHAFIGTYTDAESDETAPDKLIEAATQAIEALITKSNQELLDRIERELPEKKNLKQSTTMTGGDLRPRDIRDYGYNLALDQTKATIKEIRESL